MLEGSGVFHFTGLFSFGITLLLTYFVKLKKVQCIDMICGLFKLYSVNQR